MRTSGFEVGLQRLMKLAKQKRSANRFGGIRVAVVMLIPRPGPAWPIAFHRFAELSIGIGVALILAAAWPEMEEVATVKK
jgi:alkylation response protein AidB-like acyl-CoA dehydrogenase